MKSFYAFILVIIAASIWGGYGLAMYINGDKIVRHDCDRGIYLPMKIGQADRCVKDGGMLRVQDFGHTESWPTSVDIACKKGNSINIYRHDKKDHVWVKIEKTALYDKAIVYLFVEEEKVQPVVIPVTPPPPATPPSATAPTTPPATTPATAPSDAKG